MNVAQVNASRMFVVSELEATKAIKASYTTHRFAPHFHETYLIGATEGGGEEFNARGGLHRSAPGWLRLFNPGETHTGTAPAGRHWAYRALYPSSRLMEHAAGELRGCRAALYFRDMAVQDRGLAGALIRAVDALEGQASALERETCFWTLLVEVIARHAHSTLLHPPLGREHHAITRAKRFIADRLDTNFTLSELATAANLSPYHLARVFRRDVGMTPSQYRTNLRVARAKAVLEHGGDMAAVVDACGFFDQSHLCRAFKQVVGVTPRQYALLA